MPNRQQDYQSASRQARYRPDENDDTSRYARDYDREYGPYRDTDEGDSSVRAGSYDQGRNQGGSRGRYSGYGDFGRGNYGGEDRYAQGGYGQTGYGQPGGYPSNYNQEWSGYGQGTGRGASDEYSRNRGAQQSGPGRQGFSGQGWSEPYGEGQQYGYGGAGQGTHRGKGPKNFQRSDERIKELICERLTDDPDVDASDVTINVQGGMITLEGTVDSRQTKMKVEDIADQFGSHEVQNNLRVQKQSAGRTSSATGGAGRHSTASEDGEPAKQKRN
jgi:osmotically-inducible protein OsmY